MTTGALRFAQQFAVAGVLCAASSTSFAFEGKYLVGDESYRQTADIRKSSEGAYDVTLRVENRGCAGEFEGRGAVKNGALLIRPKQRYDATDTCVLTAKRRGASLSMTEKNDCSAWHGVNCSFEGLYEPAKEGGK